VTEELEVIISNMRNICWIRSSLLPPSSVLVKIEAAGFSETLATTYQTARGHDSEDQNPKCQHRVQLIIQSVKNKTKEFESNEPYLWTISMNHIYAQHWNVKTSFHMEISHVGRLLFCKVISSGGKTVTLSFLVFFFVYKYHRTVPMWLYCKKHQ
jgi:hypothetical protein